MSALQPLANGVSIYGVASIDPMATQAMRVRTTRTQRPVIQWRFALADNLPSSSPSAGSERGGSTRGSLHEVRPIRSPTPSENGAAGHRAACDLACWR
jgi:hypothetical protein